MPVYRRRIPPLPVGVVRRSRIDELIRATDSGGVFVLESAPGYGATTAVAQAVSGVAGTRWLSLDETVSDDLGEAMVGELMSPDASGDVWFVVDGLVPEIHRRTRDALVQWAARRSAGTRLVLAAQGRLDVPGVVAHDETLLKFTEDEAMELLAGLLDNVDVDDAARVIEDAQGWASALVAAAYRIKAGLHSHRLATTLPVELLDPWLTALPDERRRLLHQLSVVDQFCEPLVAAVSEHPSPEQLLRDLIEAHAYTSACPPPQGHTGRWWQLHPMLLTLLRQRCEGDPAGCHTRAAGWFAQTGDVGRGMDHYIAAGRYGDAVDLLERHQADLLSTGSADTVVRWFTEVAAEHHRVESLLRAAWAKVLAGDVAGAEAARARLGAAVEVVLQDDPPPVRGQAWRSEQALLDAYLAACIGDPGAVVRAGQAALDFSSLGQNPNVAQMAPVLIARGFIWGGDYRAAVDAVDACSTVRFSTPVLGNLHYGAARALMHCLSGEITDAAQIVDEMWAWARANGIDIDKVPMFAAELARAFVLLEQGELDDARDAASALGVKARASHHICDATWAQLIVAKTSLYSGQLACAVQELAAASELAGSRIADTALRVPIGHAQAQAHMAAGDTLRAERLLQDLPAGPTRTLLSAQAGLTRTPVLARKSVEALVATDPRTDSQRHLLLAAAYRKTSDRIADEHLRAAAAIARRVGLQMLLAPPAPDIREHAQRLAAEGDADLAWALSALRPAALEPSPLSRGDLQLLALIPTRARNQDIASVLGISVNTVKTRLRRLYSNLGVTDRDQAIAVARERGLLP